MIALPDMIVAGMILEGLGLLALRAFTGRGPKALIANLEQNWGAGSRR